MFVEFTAAPVQFQPSKFHKSPENASVWGRVSDHYRFWYFDQQKQLQNRWIGNVMKNYPKKAIRIWVWNHCKDKPPGIFASQKKQTKKTWSAMWMFPKIVVPPNHQFNRVFHYKPSILGYPYFWKHPCELSVSHASSVLTASKHAAGGKLLIGVRQGRSWNQRFSICVAISEFPPVFARLQAQKTPLPNRVLNEPDRKNRIKYVKIQTPFQHTNSVDQNCKSLLDFAPDGRVNDRARSQWSWQYLGLPDATRW